MRKVIFSTIVLLLLCIFAGCGKESVMLWSEKASVWFTAPNFKDSTIFTFALYPEELKDTVIGIPISMCGPLSHVDREINVEVVSNPRDPQTKYEIICPVIIPADSTNGFLQVRVFRTSNLSIERDSVVFQLQTSEDLNVDFLEHTRHWLYISNLFEQPEWWVLGSNAWYYLGEYDLTKMQIIYTVLGSAEDPMSGDIAQANINRYKLAEYVRENQPTYPNGSPVEFPFMNE